MITHLTDIVTPPTRPIEVPTAEDWVECERALGTSLPRDYHELIDRYGTVVFGDFINILNPATTAPRFVNLAKASTTILRGTREMRDKYGGADDVPYRLFPELGGLLPFGYTDNGDHLYWMTGRDPDRWTIVINASRSADWEEFKANTTEFLAGVLSGRIRCQYLPHSFPLVARVPSRSPIVDPPNPT